MLLPSLYFLDVFYLFISLNRLPLTLFLKMSRDFFSVWLKKVLVHTYDIECTCNTWDFVGLFMYLIHMCLSHRLKHLLSLWSHCSAAGVEPSCRSGCQKWVIPGSCSPLIRWLMWILPGWLGTAAGPVLCAQDKARRARVPVCSWALYRTHPLEFFRPFWGSSQLAEPLHVDAR